MWPAAELPHVPTLLWLQVYHVTVEPLVHTLFNNGKATCFAYGQTGSGKTFTMSPLPIRAAADILRYLERPELRDVELYVSCFEIYGNKVFDLLNMRKKLNILEDGKKKVCVVGLKVSRRLSFPLHKKDASSLALSQQSRPCQATTPDFSEPSAAGTLCCTALSRRQHETGLMLYRCCLQEHNVDNVDLVKQLIEEANHRRSVGSTAANADSSRSHSIMQFALKRFIAGGAASRLVSVCKAADSSSHCMCSCNGLLSCCLRCAEGRS